ncbi:carboxypeptidase S [Cristinia sonorae]|uniref:Carboxypeptidase S n=1 Tax=Cristinia sonorae TaxID=1940300 RepID=A0A8K0UIS7_9AGAR|nr:carboxypeptidase S [Cristinia sonorae]
MPPTIIVEKEGLLPLSSYRTQGKPWSFSKAITCLIVALTCTCTSFYLLGVLEFPELSFSEEDDVSSLAHLCPQPPALTPSVHADLWQDLGSSLQTEEFVNRSVDWLAGAVRIPTQSYDKMGPINEDERWKAFEPFHDYLQSSFPKVHSVLTVTKVNAYGLVYEWIGSNRDLKPLLLAAHQDVVPVNPDTLDDWVHPPFSGHFDGKLLWGRGSSDDKNGLIGILSTIEVLIEKGFNPRRSIVLAFGFDEEASGLYGARFISYHLLDKYGKNGFAMLVDEGGDYMEEYGKVIATIGTAEKGYFDVRVEVESPGGHSSVPPEHTTIGILSALVAHIEKNPYKPHLGRGTPMYEKALCMAAHLPELPKPLREALQKAPTSDSALHEAEAILFKDKLFKALVGTTQAVDLIQGGVKTNALPESAWAVVNHRIATDSSVAAVQDRDTEVVLSLAQEFNLSVTAFGKQLSGEGVPAYGKLVLSDAWGASLEPAPLTPTGDAAAYQLLAGTVKATYSSHRGLDDTDDVVVSPGHMSGNTDTRYYWQLTPHIFRYNHHFTGKNSLFQDIHTVNEFISVDAYIEVLRFFTTLILNVDESSAL